MKSKSIIDQLDDRIIRIVRANPHPYDSETEFWARIVEGPNRPEARYDYFYARLIDTPWYSYLFEKTSDTEDVYVCLDFGNRKFKVLFNQSREYVAHTVENG